LLTDLDFGRKAPSCTTLPSASSLMIAPHRVSRYFAHLSEARRRSATIAPGNLGLVSFVQKYGLTYNWLLAGAGPMRSSEYEAIKQTVHP
jgi:hypothetical protein